MLELDDYTRLPVASKQIPGVGDDALRRLLRLGRMKGRRIGRDWWVLNSEIERLRNETTHVR